MAIFTIDESQRKAAKVVGFTYLLALVTAVFAELYVPVKLFVLDNAVETARNIMAHERLFRLGITSDLITWITDVVLIAALYIVLRPVNRSLALLAAFWRLIETSILVAATLNNFDVLQILSGAGYLRVLEAERLQALASLSIDAYGVRYNVGLLFFGLGSTLFSYLWFKSRYVPRALAGWGVFSSLLVAGCMVTIFISPHAARIIMPVCGGPIFIFELIMGFWLLFKRIPASTVE